MPLINEELKFKSAESTNDQNFTQANEAFNPSKGLVSIPPHLMQIVPWIPFAIEAISGQKVPAMGGTIGEIQNSLTQIQFSLTQLLNVQQQMLSGQQQLWNKLENLENNANSHLTNLSQQVANANKDFKLLATETKRSLELTHQPRREIE